MVDRAIEAQKIPKQPVRPTSFVEGDWVLVRAEARNKFEGRWYGPYRVVKAFPLGTYRLADPEGNIVTTLINGQRLISARINDQTRTTLWNSSQVQGALRRRGLALDEPSPEVAALFEKESQDTMSYDELASIPESEWRKLERTRIAPPTQINRQEFADVDASLQEAFSSQPSATVNAEQSPNPPVGNLEIPETQEDPSPMMEIDETPEPPEGPDENDEERTVTIDNTPISETVIETEADEQPSRAVISQRIPIWQQERDAAFRRRQRDTDKYGLRQRVPRRGQG